MFSGVMCGRLKLTVTIRARAWAKKMSVSSVTEARRGDSFQAWRGPGVSLPHFSCNRFLAQPMLPTLDFPRSLHLATNGHLRWRGQSSLAAVSHFPLYWPPMATETGNAASAQHHWELARPCFRALPCLQKPRRL